MGKMVRDIMSNLTVIKRWSLLVCLSWLSLSLGTNLVAQPSSDEVSHAKKEKFIEGVHYRKVTKPLPLMVIESPTRLKPEYRYQVKVIEFFSFGCHWCYKLEPTLDQWEQSDKPKYVDLQKIPVSFRRGWGMLSKLYFVADNLKEHHDVDFEKPVFKALHEDKKNLTNVDIAAEFLATFVYDNILKNDPKHKDDSSLQAEQAIRKYKADYKRALASNPSVDLKLSDADQMVSHFNIHAIPAFVVGGLYETNIQMAQGDDKKLMRIINALSEKALVRVNSEIDNREGNGGSDSDIKRTAVAP